MDERRVGGFARGRGSVGETIEGGQGASVLAGVQVSKVELKFCFDWFLSFPMVAAGEGGAGRTGTTAGAVVVAAHHDEEDDEHEEESPGDSVHDGGGEGDRDGVVRHGRATMLLVTSAPVSSYN